MIRRRHRQPSPARGGLYHPADVFEIGNSLREARLRQGLDVEEAEQATKIRTKYLRALEEERFDILPAQTYVKGFLRTYAEYLGLNGQIYVDEYNSRYLAGGGGGDDEAPVRSRTKRPVARRRVESSVVMIALAGIAAAAALVIVAWRYGGSDESLVAPRVPTPQVGQAEQPATVPPALRWIRLELVAVRGKGSRIIVHRNGATGRLLYDGTLERGKTETFVGRRVWMNVSNPENLLVRINGRAMRWPRNGAAPVVAIASRQGIASAR